jgi:hypothetical protein
MKSVKNSKNAKVIIVDNSCGWGRFLFSEELASRLPVSYIDNVPLNILGNLLSHYTNAHPFCVSFDAEGYEYTLLSYDGFEFECIIRDREKPSIYTLDFPFEEFVNGVLEDIKNDIDEMTLFDVSFSIDLEQYLVKTGKKVTKENVLSSDLFLNQKNQILKMVHEVEEARKRSAFP